MTDTERDDLRDLQDRLLARLRRLPLVVDRSLEQRWVNPLWLGGPSPLDLEHGLYPKHRERLAELLDALEDAEGNDG